MLRLSRDQIDAPVPGRLGRVWREHAAREGLTAPETQALETPMVEWLMDHRIERPRNVDFAMMVTARTRGAFLDAEPIREAMRLSGGEYEVALSALRRQTLALAQQAEGG